MDKEKDSKRGSKSSRISEMAAFVVIVVCLILVCAELGVNVLNEMERNGAKTETASFVTTSPGLLEHEEVQ